jgi:mobilome CxxCx(11)CxxC protein
MAIDNEENEKIQGDCWDNALHSFGTAYIYSKRSVFISRLLKANNFLGLIVPVLIGGIATSYTLSLNALNTILFIAAPFSILQLVLSALSLTNKWDDTYSYYLESTNDNSSLSDDFKSLAKYPPDNLKEFKTKMKLIEVKYNIRNTNDIKYPLTAKEKREAMRYSIRNFQRSCAGCNVTPNDMIPSDCGVCGKF